MGKKSSKDRMSNEVNAGSMADIAFLLLIFFLVTTTIAEDKGVLVKLPPWSEEEPDVAKLKKRNVFSVLVNANNDLLVRGEPVKIGNLKDKTKEFIFNPKKLENMSESPKHAIISIKNDRGTKYGTYLAVYNEVKAAYNELRDEASLKQFSKNYEFLGKDKKKIIKDQIPIILSEAESSYGKED